LRRCCREGWFSPSAPASRWTIVVDFVRAPTMDGRLLEVMASTKMRFAEPDENHSPARAV
jgi:hypothetical protein